MKIAISELRRLAEKTLTNTHYSAEQAQKIVEVLLYADIIGKDTQGILKLTGSWPMQDVKPEYAPKIVRETELSALVDGGHSAGPLPGQMAVDKAIEIAGKKGFAIVGMNNTFSSVGAIGFYARKFAMHGLIGIVAASSPRTIIHYGGIDPIYGTNPIAFGFPTEDKPITFDMASSAITWFGMVRAKALGQNLPENVALDKDGKPTVDPAAAMDGALLPFDRSYKGSGLAMAVELLAGVLTGAGYVFDDGADSWGTTFIALSPSLLMDTGEFKRRSSDLVRKVKASRTAPGQHIHIPGYDREEEMSARLERDEIEVVDKILEELRAKAG